MRIKFYRNKSPTPTIGEMRHPVSLYSPDAVPDDADGFNVTLQPVANGWARVTLGAVHVDRGKEVASEELEAAVFDLRADGITGAKGHYLLHDSTVYRVLYFSWLGDAREFVSIVAVPYRLIKNSDVTIVDREGHTIASPGEEVQTPSLWTAGF